MTRKTRPCMHTATSFLDLRRELIHLLTLWNIFWNICTRFSNRGLVSLVCFWNSQQHFVHLLLAMLFSCLLLALLFFTGSRVPVPGWFLCGYFLHGHQARVSSNILLTLWMQGMTSKPTSPSESPLLFSPWNQLNSHVTGFGNTQASRGGRNHHLPRRTRMSTTLPMY